MSVWEEEYSAALARAIAEDLRANPPAGALVRVVIRWFEEHRPSYFSVHALGADERAEVPPEDAWSPLEWDNLDEELERTARVEEHPDVQRTGRALEIEYRATPPDRDDDTWRPAPALGGALGLLSAELLAAGVALDDDFAVAAAHFEGMGALATLRDYVRPAVLSALTARGELPTD
ncbi:hypothetical protein ACWIGW_17095 [Nocardia brasiliensis]